MQALPDLRRIRTHPGTNRLIGTLANRELRSLRHEAHRYFDRLYLSGLMSKEQAYEWLACLIQAPMSEAHIGYLGEYYCRRVVDASRTMLASCKGREAL